MAIEPGQSAPDFTLKNGANEPVSLSDFAGKPVVLVFYPFAFSGICEGELCQLRDDLSTFEKAGAQVIGVSCDNRHVQRVWGEQQGYGFPMLADYWPHGATAKAYGIFNDTLGCAMRATFVIDKAGTVVDAFSTDEVTTARDYERYAEAIAKL